MEKLIAQDNKQYRFKPGKNGSLTAENQPQQQPDIFNRPKVSKVVPALKNMRQKRMAAQIAAARG